MSQVTEAKPLTRTAWVWGRSKWLILSLVVLPGVLYLIQAAMFENGLERDANPFLLIACMAAIPTLWFASPLVVSYVHGLIQATDKTLGAVTGLSLMTLAGVLIFFKESVPIEIGALSPGILILGVLGFFGMLRVAGPHASTLKGVELLRSNANTALKYFEAASFTAEFRPNLLAICMQMLESGQKYQALKLAEHLTDVAPHEANNWCGRSFLAYQAGLKDESFEYLETALKLEPRNGEIYYNRAVRRSRDEESFELALKDYTKAISLNDSEARYYANRAALYNRMKRHESALADAKKAHQLDPEDHVAGIQASLALTGLGREDELESWMSRGLFGAGAGFSQGEFSAAMSDHFQGDSSALKANYAGESLTVIGPDGIRKIDVDDL